MVSDSQQDGTEPVAACFADRESETGGIELAVVPRLSTRLAHLAAEVGVDAPRAVDEVDHDQAVVDDDPGQRDEAEHRHHGDVEPHHHVSPDGADETERDGRHDDQRLHVRSQRDRQQGEDHEQGEEEPALQTAHRLDLLGLGAFESVEHPRVVHEHLGQDARLQIGDDRAGCRQPRIDRGRHVHRAVAVDPLDRSKPRPGSTCATWPNGTSAPLGVRMRMFSRSPSDRRSSRG